MADVKPHRRELKNTGYEIFIGILSILSILNLVLLYAVEDAEPGHVLYVMNALLSAIFLADFTYRLLTRRVEVAATSSATSAGPTCSPACPFQQAEDPARLPPRPGLPAPARRTASRTSSAA